MFIMIYKTAYLRIINTFGIASDIVSESPFNPKRKKIMKLKAIEIKLSD
ncbi:MAG: hypothetical protein ACTSVK_15205 [Promethearchaeota archaeon]